jgi:hypothetical protein
MSGSCVIPLLCEYDVKEMKLQTFKLKRDDNTEKESFDIKKNLTEQQSKSCLILCCRFIQCFQGWNSQVQ